MAPVGQYPPEVLGTGQAVLSPSSLLKSPYRPWGPQYGPLWEEKCLHKEMAKNSFHFLKKPFDWEEDLEEDWEEG